MNLPIHCFSTWVIIYISSWMKYKVQQNMNTINLYLVSIAANNCNKNRICCFVDFQVIFYRLWTQKPSLSRTVFLWCLIRIRHWFWPGSLQKAWEGGRKFSPGKSKNGTAPNRKPIELLWTNSYTAGALFSCSGDMYFELFLMFYHFSIKKKNHLDWNIALKDTI